MFQRVDGLVPSVSYTTREPRVNEVDGVDYHFVRQAQFRGMIENGSFVEWAEVHGNYYGTAIEALEQVQGSGKSILLEIDCQGALQLREKLPDAVYVFIAPPDYSELEQRLRKRDTDSEEVIAVRLANAKDEMAQVGHYDYVVVNENLADAVTEVEAIVMAEKLKTSRQIDLLTKNFDLHTN